MRLIGWILFSHLCIGISHHPFPLGLSLSLSLSLHTWHMSRSPLSSWFDCPNKIWGKGYIEKLVMTQFFRLLFLCPTVFLSSQYSNIPSLCTVLPLQRRANCTYCNYSRVNKQIIQTYKMSLYSLTWWFIFLYVSLFSVLNVFLTSSDIQLITHTHPSLFAGIKSKPPKTESPRELERPPNNVLLFYSFFFIFLVETLWLQMFLSLFTSTPWTPCGIALMMLPPEGSEWHFHSSGDSSNVVATKYKPAKNEGRLQ